MDMVMNYGLFFVILIVFILSFRKVDSSNEVLGKDTSSQLKGLAITTVLLGHMAIMVGIIKLPTTPYLAAHGVDIFLALSAFGLMASVTKNGLNEFWKKRLLVIVIPYIIFNIVRIPIMMGVGFAGPMQLVLGLIGIDVSFDASMWYVQYIIIWYIVFFAVSSIKKISMKGKVALLTGFGTLLLVLTIGMYLSGVVINLPIIESYSHHLAFPLGAILFMMYDKIKEMTISKYLVISAISLVIYIVSCMGIPNIGPYIVANLTFVIFLAFLFMALTKAGYKSKLLIKLGDLAYYIYLVELFVIILVVMMLQLNNVWGAILILIVSVLLGILVKLPSDSIVKKLQSRKK